MKRLRPLHRRIPPGAIKIDLPNASQLEDYTCGPSALLAICAYFGVGPEDEWDVEADMGIGKDGSDPPDLERAARRYGLRLKVYRSGMSIAELKACVRMRRPVIIMLQAWRDPPPPSYGRIWRDGHWVIAIGYDRRGVYFEDPSLHAARGFIDYDELAERWHDWGPKKKHVYGYGLVLWRPGAKRSTYARRARHID